MREPTEYERGYREGRAEGRKRIEHLEAEIRQMRKSWDDQVRRMGFEIDRLRAAVGKTDAR